MADELGEVVQLDETRMLPDGTPLEEGVEVADDGDGVVIDFSGAGETSEQTQDATAFDANIASSLGDALLKEIASKVEDHVREDRSSRRDWAEQQRKGMVLLGLKHEDRTEPWAGACGAFHPMLLESVVGFQAQTMAEVIPEKGPAKYKVTGRVSAQKERQGQRMARDLNHLTTERIPGYMEDAEQMFFKVPIAGLIWRKIWFDPVRRVPQVQNILPEDFLLPYGVSSVEKSPRYTVVLHSDVHDIKKLQQVGFYLDIELGQPQRPETSSLQEERDHIQGEVDTAEGEPSERELYECYTQYEIEGLAESDGLSRPYIITVDRASSQVMSIYRNWEEGDDTFEPLFWGADYSYMPGMSTYGTSILQILGGLSDSATSILRQLIDAGTLANIPAGFRAKSLRINKGDNTPFMPGEWREVDAMGANLRDSFLPLPYKEPSSTLHSLLGDVVGEGRRLGATADAKISEIGSQQMPVGTTLAILESITKIMSGTMRRMHRGMKRELKVLKRIVRDYMPEEYPFELDKLEEGANRKQDYAGDVDVIPVSNPNSSTMAMRIMKTQAVMALAQQQPELYDMPALHMRMLLNMQVEDASELMPSADEVQPRDPVTENMDLINGRPVRAGMEQDHEAHITVHMAALRDPKMAEVMEENPSTPAILAAGAAHIQEHVAFQYRMEIEKALGVPLPPPDEPMPADVEYQVSQLAAKAADKVLGRNKAEEQRQEILDQMEDPMVQMRRQELDIKQQEADSKTQEAKRRLDLQEKKQADDLSEASLDRQTDVAQTLIDAQIEGDENLTKQQIEGVKEGVSLVKDIEKIKGANKSKGTGETK